MVVTEFPKLPPVGFGVAKAKNFLTLLVTNYDCAIKLVALQADVILRNLSLREHPGLSPESYMKQDTLVAPTGVHGTSQAS